jgi:hypothetical protein
MAKSAIDRELELRWLALTASDRAAVLVDLGVDGKDPNILGGKTIDEIVNNGSENLPIMVKGRLLLAITDKGFTREEYERSREEFIRFTGESPACERAN